MFHIRPEELRVTLGGTGATITFLIDTGATYSALTSFSGPTCRSSILLTGMGTGSAGLLNSIFTARQLSLELTQQIANLAAQINMLLSSLAEVVLQNRRAQDLLTAYQGGTCAMFKGDCCILVNQLARSRPIFGPCIFNLLVKFISSRIQQINLQMVKQQEYQPDNTRTTLEQVAITFHGARTPP